MARNQGPPPSDDSQTFYRAGRGQDEGGSSVVEKAESRELDERFADLDSEDDDRFLRAPKRVPVRKGALPRKTATRLRWAIIALIALTVLISSGVAIYRYGSHSWRFRIESSDSILVTGAEHVSRQELMRVFGDDISRNIFAVPLDERKRKLEGIAWVESASVMRILPNKLKVEIRERVPVAFVQLGSQVALIDANGIIMSVPPSAIASYSFPVIINMSATEPLSTRAPRMKTYTQLIEELDSGGAHYSQDLSEVDLSDPNDLKVTVSDAGAAVLIHLGERQRAGIFLDRYKIYVTHLQEWKQQYPKLKSVDLRFEEQVVLEPVGGEGVTSAQASGEAKPAKPVSAKTLAPKKHARKP